MRIGILTWFSGYNYGARAQSYALLNVILKLGHDCEFVNFEPKDFKKYCRKGNLNCWYPYRRPIRAIKCFIRCFRYEKDLKKLSIGTKVYSAEEIDSLGYDMIIIGSDSIFNIHHPMFHSVYYGVGLKKTPYIYYAPSCESMNTEEELPEELCEALYHAKVISVRDENTRTIIKRALKKNDNRDISVLLDPSLLYDYCDITSLIPEKNYILIYSFSNWGKYSEEFKRYAKDHNLKIISVGRYCPWADFSYDMASFSQWLGCFVNARIVLTDSFHGVVFGIKNRKQLVLMSRDDKCQKISEMLKLCKIDNYSFYCGQNLDEYLETNMFQYDEINVILEVLKQQSLEFLWSNLLDDKK